VREQKTNQAVATKTAREQSQFEKKEGGCTQILQKQQKADNPRDKPLHKKCT
jgi:hypothetical protein